MEVLFSNALCYVHPYWHKHFSKILSIISQRWARLSHPSGLNTEIIYTVGYVEKTETNSQWTFRRTIVSYLCWRLCWQVRVQATDAGTPPRVDTCVVTVNVNRNLKTPKMTQSKYSAQLLETQDLGVPFMQVNARDEDQKVCFTPSGHIYYKCSNFLIHITSS